MTPTDEEREHSGMRYLKIAGSQRLWREHEELAAGLHPRAPIFPDCVEALSDRGLEPLMEIPLPVPAVNQHASPLSRSRVRLDS